ncbi:MAG: DUF58 domain-containing protein, partial [Planctomycetota bacterium]|nr:DUF58 domain-containing protein [Planctomycetota bacterium]
CDQGPAGFETPMRQLARKHEVVAIHISDPREYTLPDAGLVEIADPETGRSGLVDTSSRRVRDAYAAAALRRDAQLASVLARTEVDRVTLSTSRPFIPDLVRYFRMREHRR